MGTCPFRRLPYISRDELDAYTLGGSDIYGSMLH